MWVNNRSSDSSLSLLRFRIQGRNRLPSCHKQGILVSNLPHFLPFIDLSGKCEWTVFLLNDTGTKICRNYNLMFLITLLFLWNTLIFFLWSNHAVVKIIVPELLLSRFNTALCRCVILCYFCHMSFTVTHIITRPIMSVGFFRVLAVFLLLSMHIQTMALKFSRLLHLFLFSVTPCPCLTTLFYHWCKILCKFK
jgi:hypothetical protein